jgi:hypothetical protein
VDDHASVCVDPMAHDSPPLGVVTVIVGWTTVKFALELSRMALLEMLEILMRADAVALPVTVHASEPSFAVFAAMTVGNDRPPSVERSILTFPVTLLDVQRIV